MNRYNSRDQFVTIPKKKLGELSAKSFEVKVRGQIIKGFVIKKNEQYFAYQNLCRHLPVTLDLNDSNFFTFDKGHLQCHMHGAMYEPETGFCVAGPCQGARLRAFDVEEEETKLVIRIPDDISET